MKKGLVIVAGAALGAVLLAGAVIFAGSTVVRAAEQVGRRIGIGWYERMAATNAFTNTVTAKGIVIVAVATDSPADKAGVKRGDVLLKIDNTEVNLPSDLQSALRAHKSGDTVKLSLTRGDETLSLSATLADNNGVAYLGIEGFGGRGMRGMFGYPGPGNWISGTHTMPFGSMGPGNWISGTNVFVTEVVTDSPASKAGIVRGDVIQSVDGKTFDITNTLSSIISSYKPGDSVKLQVVSQGQSVRDVAVVLGESPTTKGLAYLGVRYAMGFGHKGFRHGFGRGGRGMPFVPGTPGQTTAAVIVRSVTKGSPADTAGLVVGDIITAIDGKAINTPQSLVDTVTAHKVGDELTLTVQKSGATSTTDIKVTLGDNPDKKGTAYLGISISGRMYRMVPGTQGQGTDSRGLPNFDIPGLRRFFGGNGGGQQQQNNNPSTSGSTL